jgi:hypothetical protein
VAVYKIEDEGFDNITVTLPSSGIYYLVYDNSFSAASKNVATQVDYIP